MVKLSFQMLLKQRKKSLNLMTVITTVLIIWMILLDFFANPMINYRLKRAFINMIDFYQLFDGMFKGTIILIVIIVSFSLIIYACNSSIISLCFSTFKFYDYYSYFKTDCISLFKN